MSLSISAPCSPSFSPLLRIRAYRRGTDPEYAWYQDRDGDGVVCER
ncbi:MULTISPECIES: excalibur calcium-binding domain-containing protein [unclassified Streptosporangium]|nr:MULTISPECIES: excalibur calcium-binding domain-containing protein [unclassified Streptosporangium]